MTLPLPRRAYIGLQLVPNLGEVTRAPKLAAEAEPSTQGLLVRAVAAASSAEAAGVQAGDRLLKIGDRNITQLNDARTALRGIEAGQRLSVEVWRGSSTHQLETVVRPYPTESHSAARVKLGTVELPERGASGKHRLRALALIPEAPPVTAGYPVVYYLPGAHWASEEYPFAPLHPVPALLGGLAARGIASVRVERSGLGDSEGSACTETDFESELAGYQGGYQWIGQQPWADGERIILLGHSLGAMVAPLLVREVVEQARQVSASDRKPQSAIPQGVITYGASAIPITAGLVGALERYATLRLASQTTASAASTEKLPLMSAEQLAQQSALLRLVVAGQRTPREALAERPDLRLAAPDHFTDETIYRRNVRFYHQLQTAPIETAWRECPCPLLALHGTSDWVTSLTDSQRLAAYAAKSDVLQVRADHQMADPSLVRNRVELEAAAIVPDLASLRLAPGLCDLIADWVLSLS